MTIVSINHIRDICKELEILPEKSKGQNFLINQGVIDRIIDFAKISKNDHILEVGPGLGVLTSELLGRAGKLTAVELEDKLIGYLESRFKNESSFELIHDDILKLLTDKEFDLGDYRVIANLPYAISSRFLRLILERKNKPSEMILMLQKEVGERIVAKPSKMSVLSVMVQFYSEPEILFKVSKKNYWPEPKVDSVVMRLNVRSELPDIDERKFFKVVKVGFSAKRKMLKNNLGNVYETQKIAKAMEKLSLDSKIRPEGLAVQSWVELAKLI
jgi:16S rRNA (adenine1518-N6/adenine1519-N6)-dimethyltransferase